MNFLNPYEVLELNSFDTAELKKAKKRKLAEFELSDNGTIDYKTQKIHKADFIKAVDELDNEQKNQFYWALKSQPNLSNFLSTGDSVFFTYFEQQRVFANPEFIAFISPYFAFQYNKLFFRTFREANQGLLKKIVAAPLLVSPAHTDTAYQQTRAFLQTEIQTINTLNNELNDEESEYSTDTAAKILPDISRNLNVTMLNLLPDYFQTQRNDLAQKLRNVSVAVFNTLDNAKVSLDIINFALQLNINNLTKQNLEKDQQQIADIHKERVETAKHQVNLLKYILVVNRLHSISKTPDLIASPHELWDEIDELINPQAINSEPDLFDEVRNQIVLTLRAISILVYNEHQNIEIAQRLIQKAQQININDWEIKNVLTEAVHSLENIIGNHRMERRKVAFKRMQRLMKEKGRQRLAEEEEQQKQQITEEQERQRKRQIAEQQERQRKQQVAEEQERQRKRQIAEEQERQRKQQIAEEQRYVEEKKRQQLVKEQQKQQIAEEQERLAKEKLNTSVLTLIILFFIIVMVIAITVAVNK